MTEPEAWVEVANLAAWVISWIASLMFIYYVIECITFKKYYTRQEDDDSTFNYSETSETTKD